MNHYYGAARHLQARGRNSIKPNRMTSDCIHTCLDEEPVSTRMMNLYLPASLILKICRETTGTKFEQFLKEISVRFSAENRTIYRTIIYRCMQ